jgi:hypothetical protein
LQVFVQGPDVLDTSDTSLPAGQAAVAKHLRQVLQPMQSSVSDAEKDSGEEDLAAAQKESHCSEAGVSLNSLEQECCESALGGTTSGKPWVTTCNTPGEAKPRVPVLPQSTDTNCSRHCMPSDKPCLSGAGYDQADLRHVDAHGFHSDLTNTAPRFQMLLRPACLQERGRGMAENIRARNARFLETHT